MKRKSDIDRYDETLDADESRTREHQAALERFSKRMLSRSVNPLEIINPHPDYDYFWFARSVLNEEIPMGLQSAIIDEWVPVTNSEMPEMSDISNQCFNGRNSGHVENGNLILHKRHKDFGRMEQQNYERKRMELRRAMDHRDLNVNGSSSRVDANSLERERLFF